MKISYLTLIKDVQYNGMYWVLKDLQPPWTYGCRNLAV